MVNKDKWAWSTRVGVAYRISPQGVAEGKETGTELVLVQLSRVVLVVVVERGAELPQLVFGETHSVSDEDLVLHLVDTSANISIELTPRSTEGLHGRGGKRVMMIINRNKMSLSACKQHKIM